MKMKKTAILAAILFMTVMAGYGQTSISNGESMSSVRTKLNYMRKQVDTLNAQIDSVKAGTLTVGGSLDTITAAGKIVVVDSIFRSKEMYPGYLKAGGTTNYTEIDRSGVMTMAGTAKRWVEIPIAPIVHGDTGATTPDFEMYANDGGTSRGVWLYSFNDALTGHEKELSFTALLPSNYDGDTIYVSVHWIPAVALGGVGHPRFGLEYDIAEPGSDFTNTVTSYKNDNTDGKTTLEAMHHYITEFGAIKPAATLDAPGTVLIGRLFRNSSNALDTYNANKVGILYISLKCRINAIGSESRY